MAENDKKLFCCTPYPTPYIWSWFMGFMCKMMTSPDAKFFQNFGFPDC